jgi:hypothetical protein
MSYIYYNYAAYIQPDSDLDLIALKNKLDALYQSRSESGTPEITVTDYNMTILFGQYKFTIGLVDEPFVHEEASEFAEHYTVDRNEKEFDKEQLRSCKKRLEIYGDDDPDMDYFNDHLDILDTIETFNGVIVLGEEG